MRGLFNSCLISKIRFAKFPPKEDTYLDMMRKYSEQQPEVARLLALSEELQRLSDIQLRKLDEGLAICRMLIAISQTATEAAERVMRSHTTQSDLARRG